VRECGLRAREIRETGQMEKKTKRERETCTRKGFTEKHTQRKDQKGAPQTIKGESGRKRGLTFYIEAFYSDSHDA